MAKITKSALQRCKACDREVSKVASKCPHCGEPSASTKLFKVGLLLIFLGLVGIPALVILLFIIIAIIAAASGSL